MAGRRRGGWGRLGRRGSGGEEWTSKPLGKRICYTMHVIRYSPAPVPITCDEVRRILQEYQPELAERFAVRSLALFGSVARDEATPDSDIDLLVEFDRPVGLFELFALQDELEEMLGRPVDVGTVQSLKPRIQQRVLEEAVRVL